MFLVAVPNHRRERLRRLGTAVRTRIYHELHCGETPEGDVIDAIVYPGPEVSVYDNSADDD